MMDRRVKVRLYRWAGSWGPFRITSECLECDFAVAAVQEVLSAHSDWPVDFEIKPFLGHAWEALRHGGWHAPVLIIGGRLVTQGRVPTRRQIESAIQFALTGQLPHWPERPGDTNVNVPSGCC